MGSKKKDPAVGRTKYERAFGDTTKKQKAKVATEDASPLKKGEVKGKSKPSTNKTNTKGSIHKYSNYKKDIEKKKKK
jgi:hypothetical protein